jgi:hypothetical protein
VETTRADSSSNLASVPMASIAWYRPKEGVLRRRSTGVGERPCSGLVLSYPKVVQGEREPTRVERGPLSKEPTIGSGLELCDEARALTNF